MQIIGLDLATNAGMAYCSYGDEYNIKCTMLIGSPYEQILKISELVDLSDKNIFIIEDFVYFGRNAKGTKSLLMRMGFFYHMLEEVLEQTVILMSPNTSRTYLKKLELPASIKNKKKKEQSYHMLLKKFGDLPDDVELTDDITDAISLVLTQQKLDYNELRLSYHD